ncbi:hypothetical protein, partial [Moritella sp.]|uniref:hypothetical protein n=1 Tax=Moritella sp. TaxID=78556 RepID=UPI0025FDF3EA
IYLSAIHCAHLYNPTKSMDRVTTLSYPQKITVSVIEISTATNSYTKTTSSYPETTYRYRQTT